MKAATGRWSLIAAIVLGVAAVWLVGATRAKSAAAAQAPTRLALLVADGVEAADPRLLVWQEAARELGFEIETVNASSWMRAPGQWRDAALVLPDALHRRANDMLVGAVIRHVEDGGRLLLVHDAATADLADAASPRQSRLSALAGVRYALQPVGPLPSDPQQAARAAAAVTYRLQPIWASAAAAQQLQVPPGKLLREADGEPLTSRQPAPAPDERLHIAAYGYGRLDYPSFATDEGRGYDGRVLMRGDDGTLVAGVRAAGRGQVLFANLPLGWLKLRTDGFFLHALLRLYAHDIAGLPQLATVPGGVGAQVMNWHVDSNAAVPAMSRMAELGVLDQGPYSVHLTAGPDVDGEGDGRGMGLDTNESMRRWVAALAAGGHELGSHGGWTHNEFGRLVSTQARERSVAMIERNIRSVEAASGRPVREYSAPVGNHPAWVTEWLRARGVTAYYTTGDSGMAPTRSFQDGVPAPPGMWAFPVTNFGSIAAFEEADKDGDDDANLGAWLSDLAEFCANRRTVRLTYFHPPGAARHPKPFVAWLDRSAALVAAGRLRWMTMAQVVEFLEQRRATAWRIEPPAGGSPARLSASHPTSLQRLSWLLPASRWAQPIVRSGQAAVVRDGAHWRVDALGGTQLSVELPAADPPATSA